jgi:hypothetical protein
MTNVRGLSRALGLRPFHCHDSRRSWGPGFPDLVIAGPLGVLFRECKGSGGVVSFDQRQWIAELNAAGADAGVWRPEDWRSGRIEQQLREIARATASRTSRDQCSR